MACKRTRTAKSLVECVRIDHSSMEIFKTVFWLFSSHRSQVISTVVCCLCFISFAYPVAMLAIGKLQLIPLKPISAAHQDARLMIKELATLTRVQSTRTFQFGSLLTRARSCSSSFCFTFSLWPFCWGKLKRVDSSLLGTLFD